MRSKTWQHSPRIWNPRSPKNTSFPGWCRSTQQLIPIRNHRRWYHSWKDARSPRSRSLFLITNRLSQNRCVASPSFAKRHERMAAPLPHGEWNLRRDPRRCWTTASEITHSQVRQRYQFLLRWCAKCSVQSRKRAGTDWRAGWGEANHPVEGSLPDLPDTGESVRSYSETEEEDHTQGA